MAPSKRKREESAGGAPEWMCTFSDMMSLLLCFFVLLFSLSTIEKVKFQQVIGAIQGSFGRIPSFFNLSFVKPISIQPQKVEPAQRTKALKRAKEAIAKKARNKLVADETSKEVVVEGVEEGIRFSIAGRLLFEAGAADVNPGAIPLLVGIAEILNDFSELKVRVEGHASATPLPPNSYFLNNWKLAQARAFSVLKVLQADDKGKVRADRLSHMSCGEFRPRFPNDTPEDRALNRRVEILLLQGSQSEMITGVLEGSKDPKEIPNESNFVPGL
ncbi:MAG: hypothetical protein C4527_07190 [Candidatus Omnitrophota bacterium]|jgi:chemotaxis protein MotB|nr:MAG: hypothetical protein C4527_07190 [Candidatus Omnitrophota bacterium]